MFFSDIHIHLLCGTDDGAKTVEDMQSMADMAYNNGTRFICATPHFHPGYFGDNRVSSAEAFEKLREYCEKKYPDLRLMLGNELYYKHDCVSWIKSGAVRTLGNTRYVMIEFSVEDSENLIAEAVDRLLNAGFIPVIAHAERYRRLSLGRLLALRENGALVQVNADSAFLRFNFGVKRRLKAMLAEKAADFAGSDAHDVLRRPPDVKKFYEYLVNKYDKSYAKDLCFNNAQRLLCQEFGEEEV